MTADVGENSFYNEQVRTLINSSLDAVIAIDEQGLVVEWNHQAATTFGWQRNEVLGRELAELILPEGFRDKHRAGLAHYRETREAPILEQRLELTACRRDGQQIPIEFSVTQLTSDATTSFVAYVRDISDWHAQEDLQSLEVLEAKLVGESAIGVARAESYEDSLRRILDTICEQINWPLGHVWLPNDSDALLLSSHIWHVDDTLDSTELRSATANLRLQADCGLPGEIWKIGKPIWLEDIDDSSNFPRAAEAVAAGIHSVFGFPVISHRRIEAILEFFHPERHPRDDELLSIVSRLGRQVGELVHRRRYEYQQARLAAIVGSSYDAIIGKDMNGNITSWNTGAEFVYGYSESEAVGSSISIILPKDKSAEEPEIELAMQTGQRLDQFETTRRRKDGTLVPVSLTISPIVDGSGMIVGSSAIERDISSRLRRENELQTAKESAAKANRTRGEFLANISHELRTPMNAIIGMTQIALDEPLSDEVREYVATANEAAHSLLAILNDILDFSKMESGKFTITNERFSLTELIDETLKTISSLAFDKGLELICDAPRDLPRQMIGDAMRLRQVLTNLLVNAIKFTERGEVILRIQLVRQWQNEVRIRFSVIDSGIGIAPEHHSRVLEPFAQADASTTREHGGTGLGLAICSELLRLMGSKLSLASELGQGSTFSFRLSFDLPDEVDRASVDGSLLEKLRQLPVLVVDDNETNSRLISETLKNWSMEPTVARDAYQAIGIFERTIASGQAFPLVIVDALMPGMDGYELSRKLASLAPRPKTPIILMVSSTDRREFREREEAAEIAVYLQKPVTQSDLMEAVAQAFQLQPQQMMTTNALESKRSNAIVALSILLAEDVPANQQVVATVLKKRGHAVAVADNGREAVELFKKQAFDAVLMDVQMPILDGYQATAAIREIETHSAKSTPIIAMTAHAMRGDREKCLEAGMDAYIAKPLDAKQLLDLIESIVEDRSVVHEVRTEAPPVQPNDRVTLDYAGAMQRLGQDADLYREFIGFYEEDSKVLLEQIEDAVRATDAHSLQHAAHSLKGLAGNLGAIGVVDAAFTLERSGKSGSFDEVPAQVAALRDEMVRLDAALGEYRS